MTRRLLPLLAALLAVALAGCGGEDRVRSWRGLELELPRGWVVFEESPTLLGIADAPLGEDAGDPGDRTVAAQFTVEAGATPDDWRAFVEQEDGELEVDERIEVGGVPATRMVFAFTTNDIPMREMVVVIPSRELVVLMQPVPAQGETDAPEVFLEHRDEFDQILDSIVFGAPVSAQRVGGGAAPDTIGDVGMSAS